MRKPSVSFPVAAGCALAILTAVSFSLSCLLTSRAGATRGADDLFLGRLLGESRRAIGNSFSLEADRYFHRGVAHHKERAFTDLIQRLRDEVQPRTHEHLSDTEINEIMPWLRFATRMDPRNVDAYIGAAFWVSDQRGGKLEQALSILDEARKKNPSNYRIPLQRGMILLHYGETGRAARAFDRALKLWPNAPRVSEERKRLDLVAIFNYRGFLYELEGRDANALSCYRCSLSIKPDTHGLRDIVKSIESGRRSREDVEKTLHAFTSRHVDRSAYCPYRDTASHYIGMPQWDGHEHNEHVHEQDHEGVRINR